MARSARAVNAARPGLPPVQFAGRICLALSFRLGLCFSLDPRRVLAPHVDLCPLRVNAARGLVRNPAAALTNRTGHATSARDGIRARRPELPAGGQRNGRAGRRAPVCRRGACVVRWLRSCGPLSWAASVSISGGGSRLAGADGRRRRRRDDPMVREEVREEVGGDRGADQEDGR
jgi:hypothetical protein